MIVEEVKRQYNIFSKVSFTPLSLYKTHPKQAPILKCFVLNPISKITSEELTQLGFEEKMAEEGKVKTHQKLQREASRSEGEAHERQAQETRTRLVL